MANTRTYHEEKNIEKIQKLRKLEKDLPAFIKAFFRGIDSVTQPGTQIAYAIDLKLFFNFLKGILPEDFDKEFIELTDPKVLEKITADDIEAFIADIKYHTDEKGNSYVNKEAGIKRKISSVRAMFNYYHSHQIIDKNPSLQVRVPKIHDKNIIRMDPNEVAEFLDTVESGSNMSDKQLKCHEKTKIRDIAITTLLLGTGIRVSECVGLDIFDVDFNNDRINIVRKGGNESFVYFGEEVRETLLEYMDWRDQIVPVAGHENALFYSTQNKRITVRSVEKLVKKYAQMSVSGKKITPHKLRSTYGTQLYQETGDIYLVADVLGHKDVNTTRKHYAAIEESRRRSAKDAVKLRKD